MTRKQGKDLDRKKFYADPVIVTTIVLLIVFLTLFILYPLAILLVDSFVGDGSFGFSIFKRIFAMPTFTRAITNTLKVSHLKIQILRFLLTSTLRARRILHSRLRLRNIFRRTKNIFLSWKGWI